MLVVHLLTACVAAVLLLGLRIYLLLPANQAKQGVKPESAKSTCSLAVFLGSGGHTAEMRTLLSSLDRKRYTPRTYVLCHGDTLSAKAIDSMEKEGSGYEVIHLPRARRVGQGWISTIFSTVYTGLIALYWTFLLPLATKAGRPWVDALVVNGPGTCVVLVMICWIRRILGLSHTKVIYVESFARVRSLSLSAKLLRSLVDTFVVQWPEAAGPTPAPQVRYKGWLV